MADEISLVRAGDVWRYYCATNPPSSPITAWREVSFDDTFWLQGPSGFCTIKADPFSQATTWPKNCRSVYLRRTFIVSDPASVKWLVLRLDYQSGFVAYLNGQEIVRQGLTNTPPAFDDFATFHSGFPSIGLNLAANYAEAFDASAGAGALVAGTNVLAIEVHTAATNNEIGLSAGISTNHMLLVPELLANFQRGPFLQNATTNSIQVIWRTPVPADTAVDFGTNEALGSDVSDATLTTNHVATMTGLLPGTRYFYQVRSTAGVTSAVSPTYSFNTLKASGDICFLEIGDSGTGSAAQYSLVGAMKQAGADLVVHVGDVLYPDFANGLEDIRCLSVYGQIMHSVPFYFTMGNHDVDVDDDDDDRLLGPGTGEAYLSTFYLPTNSMTGTEHYYSFDHGDAHFVVLFLPYFAESTTVLTNYDLYEGSAQYCWLTNDLAASSKPWKFIFLHCPPATSGNHRMDNYNQFNPHFGTTNLDWQVEQSLLLPVAQRYGVQMFFSGHSHDYERFMPINGVHFFVNGCGGGNYTGIEPAPPSEGGGRDAFSSQFYSTPGVTSFTKVTVHGDSLLLQGILADGTVFDYMTIQRALPPAQVYNSTWNTTLVEVALANDGFGNITGQTFNLVGTPIPALAGFAANLGRVYVNNDATNLFIGFEQSMFPSNSTVFLFIESPRQNGVANLIGLGDGIVGSDEGVDGLDFLENLSFTNFTPSVACLLGDEYADAQARHFTRPGSPLDAGQGVFRLDTNFSDVPGIRLQQFNCTPNFNTSYKTNYPERNADFMEVAIPLEQLGGLQLGDTIKIAAVVGLGGCDTNARTRELDTGFLGSSMTGSGQSNVVIGAISVRLAQKTLLVRADDIIRPYGATNPPLTVTYEGFMNGDGLEVLSGSPVISTVAGTNAPVGAYPIELSAGTLSNANYCFSCSNGILTVTPAVLMVRANDQARTYGSTNRLLAETYSGFVNGQDTNIISGEPALWASAETNSPVGTYWITVSKGTMEVADTNYCLVFSNGVLTVIPASSTNTLFSSKNPSTNGIPVTFTVSVSPIPPAAAIPTGSVSFLTNGIFLMMADLSNGVACVNMNSLPPGTNEIAAAYSGDGNYLGSTNFLQQLVLAVPIMVTNSDFLLNIVKIGTNTFTFSLMGTTNALYCLLETTNISAPMTDWVVFPDSTNIATNGIWSYTITNAEIPEGGCTYVAIRFFRAKAVNFPP